VVGYDDILASVQCLKSGYNHFTHILQALQSSITPWLQAIAWDPILFIIPSTPFLEVYDKGFPAIDTGEFPDFIVNPQAFSLLQEMLRGYIWRLTCDAVLSVGTIQARKFLAKFLEIPILGPNYPVASALILPITSEWQITGQHAQIPLPA
jgi:hypothetical protein